ncbi:MAG: DUF1524 domain-containing protein [Salinibacterium sp.]|nr:DUF1524 domain-containing protein [Salinibacterium sp.]
MFAAIIVVLGGWIAVGASQPISAPSASLQPGDEQRGPQLSDAETSAPLAETTHADEVQSSSLAIVEPPLLGKSAVEVLAMLTVHVADSGANYQRTQDFGEAWMDVDGNGCSTRDDILLRDLASPQLNGCKVMSGSFVDPYSGQSMSFTRGNDTSTLVQIDHMVALLNAWTSGAQRLTQDQRQRLANDPTNLLAVSDQTNQSKSASDAASWLPPFPEVHCEYAARQISVKYAYGLWVTQSEHDALAKVLESCPSQPAYRSSLGVFAAPTPTTTTSPVPPVGIVGDTGAGTYYANCSEAYAAGVSRIERGTPGYSAKLDGDDDGIACEG